MEAEPGYSRFYIKQTYLKSSSHVTHRIRKCEGAASIVYTETKKIRIDKMSAYEDEREITAAEYEELSSHIKEGTSPIIKVRHTFFFEAQKFEIDVYPECNDTCIMETELQSKDTGVKMPSFVEIVCEVTGEKEYSNASMSKKFPEEMKI